MTKIPKDFKITEAHREYCAKRWGRPTLPDVYLSDFIECFDEDEGGNGRKHKNWDMTFRNSLRNNSPQGRFYNAAYWEKKLGEAKRIEYGPRKPKPPAYHPKELKEPVRTPQVAEIARNRLRELLG